MQPDLVDQVLFDEDYVGEVPRKRTTSVSKMDRKDSVVPEEEDDDERPPLVNGLPGQSLSHRRTSCAVFVAGLWHRCICSVSLSLGVVRHKDFDLFQTVQYVGPVGV